MSALGSSTKFHTIYKPLRILLPRLSPGPWPFFNSGCHWVTKQVRVGPSAGALLHSHSKHLSLAHLPPWGCLLTLGLWEVISDHTRTTRRVEEQAPGERAFDQWEAGPCKQSSPQRVFPEIQSFRWQAHRPERWAKVCLTSSFLRSCSDKGNSTWAFASNFALRRTQARIHTANKIENPNQTQMKSLNHYQHLQNPLRTLKWAKSQFSAALRKVQRGAIGSTKWSGIWQFSFFFSPT